MTSTTLTSAPGVSRQAAQRIPAGFHTITPHLVCAGAAAAIEFYKRAFGAVELSRATGPDGRLWNAQLKIGDSPLMIVDEFPEMGSRGPKAVGGTSVTIHLYVDDADVSFALAVRAGCTVRMPLADMFWGDRYGLLEDPYGHSWSIATHRRDVGAEELAAAIRAIAAGGGCCGGGDAAAKS